MPKTVIDYSNTIIYKITCKDTEIKDVYVGHTTNFVQRKHAHKQGCNNQKSSNYDCKLYNTIREKGGWTNWTMEIVHFFNCCNHYEARQKEQEYFISLNANLNSIEPMPNPKEKLIKPVKIKQLYICEACNVNCHTLKGLETHNETNKHKKKMLHEEESDNVNISKTHVITNNKFICGKCDYTTIRKSQYDRHLLTSKHTKIKMDNDSVQQQFQCKCGNSYAYLSGLCKHRKKCKGLDDEQNKNKSIDKQTDTDIIIQLIKQNSELQKQILDMCKNNTNQIL